MGTVTASQLVEGGPVEGGHRRLFSDFCTEGPEKRDRFRLPLPVLTAAGGE
jgi:hypothetical protein